MRLYWIAVTILISLTLAGCGGSYQVGEQAQELAPGIPKEPPSQEPVASSSENTSIPKLPAPTIGAVVITNTTATPISSTVFALTPTSDPAFQSLTQQAREDLAKRLSMSINNVDLLKIVPAKWPYDSLGCPLAGTKNADANTPGYQILLMADDQVYAYHTDGKELFGLCKVKPPNEIRTLP
jgi:hypothetical protein